MNYKKILTIILFLILIGFAGFLVYKYRDSIPQNIQNEQKTSNVLFFQDKQITDTTKPFTINITYPQIAGLNDFNQRAKDIVEKELNSFKTNSLANDQAVKNTDPINYADYPREYEINISYDKGQVNDEIISVVFNIYTFEGGAHGNSYFISLNYNVITKAEIKLSDLFVEQEDYLQKISDYCIADLTKQITKALDSTSGTWINDGAGPKAENFKFFLINPDNTITFYFPQYQVAFGAAGNFKVTMPR